MIGGKMDSEEVTTFELGYLYQLIDVLDVLKNYNTIEEVREDVELRKKIYWKDIEDMENRLERIRRKAKS